MRFSPERLITLRQSLGITKAEAARMLKMSAMGYGRYESGEREPSFQTVSFIAQKFNTSVEYLYGETDHMKSDVLTISSIDDPDLFDFVQILKTDKTMLKRLMIYVNSITRQ